MADPLSIKRLVSSAEMQWPDHLPDASAAVSNGKGNAGKSMSAGSLWNTTANISSGMSNGGKNTTTTVQQKDDVSELRSQPTTVTWQAITVTTKQGKILVNELDGRVRTGELTAVLGPGHGKSILLDALSGFTNHKVSGKILVNGVEKDMNSFRKISCYVLREDHILSCLTVEETIGMAAALKIPTSVTKEERKTLVQRAISRLDLSSVRNSKSCRLSPTERKRLCIAQELVNDPPVVFLDEPISDMDALSGLHCIKLLKDVAVDGKTVVCSMHQPNGRTFEVFDKLYMIADGQCVFRGPIQGLELFLSDQGLSCPQNQNPADFAMELMEGICGEWNLKLKEAAHKLIDDDDKSFIDKSLTIQAKKFETTLEVNTIESLQDKRRKKKASFFKMTLHIQLICHITSGLIIGTLYYGIGIDACNYLDNNGFLFVSAVFAVLFAKTSAIFNFPVERMVASREHLNSWYSAKAYFLAKSISEIPLQVLFATVFCSIVYWLSFQPNEGFRFLLFTANVAITYLTAYTDGVINCSLSGSQYKATVIGATSISLLIMFSGFFVRPSTVPSCLNWLTYVSYLRYAYHSALFAVFGFDRADLGCHNVCHIRRPADFLAYVEADESKLYVFCGVQVTYFFVLKIMSYFVIRRKLKHFGR